MVSKSELLYSHYNRFNWPEFCTEYARVGFGGRMCLAQKASMGPSSSERDTFLHSSLCHGMRCGYGSPPFPACCASRSSLRTPSSPAGNANEIGTKQTNKKMTELSSSPCRPGVHCLPSASAIGTRNTTGCDGHGPYPGRDGPRATETRSSSCCRYWASPSTRCFWSRRRA